MDVNTFLLLPCGEQGENEGENPHEEKSLVIASPALFKGQREPAEHDLKKLPLRLPAQSRDRLYFFNATQKNLHLQALDCLALVCKMASPPSRNRKIISSMTDHPVYKPNRLHSCILKKNGFLSGDFPPTPHRFKEQFLKILKII